VRARILLGALLGAIASTAVVAGGACSDSVPSDQQTTTTTTTGSGGRATTATGVDAGCSSNPKTYLEIINACTDAQAVAVSPVLPLLLPDGGLPPLP
jgi:hypothetical protein